MSDRSALLTGTARLVAKERLEEIAAALAAIDRAERELHVRYQELRDEQARLNCLVYSA